MGAGHQTSEQLQASLRLCQLELAQVRSAQEVLTEECLENRQRLHSSEGRFKELSRRVNTHLGEPTAGSDLLSKVQRRLEARRKTRSEEWQLVRLLRSSKLFSGPWYLRQYPQVVSTGLLPALHYLRHGVQEDLDPGPHFSTHTYLAAHPELASSGTNPLVHHLQAQQHEARPTRQT